MAKISDKAKAAFNRVVNRLKDGDISPITDIVRIRIPKGCPAANWSARNRILALAQMDTLDARTYLQWQAVGRQVDQKGASFLWQPNQFFKKDEDTGERERVFCGFKPYAVFPLSMTKPIEDFDPPYEPINLEPKDPPLLDHVARFLGLTVKYEEIPGAYGSFSQSKNRIRLATHDPYVWFHELGHKLHEQIIGKLKDGQDPHQEAVADLFATVLMELYNVDDRTGNTYKYICHYHKDPLAAVDAAMIDIGKMLELLETIEEEACLTEQS